MRKSRPETTGYARIAQAEELSDDEEAHDRLIGSYASLPHASATQYASITPAGLHQGMHSDGTTTPKTSHRPRSRRRRLRSNSSGVDIKAINARLERWAEDIAAKFKTHRSKGKSNTEEGLEIQHSVFQAPEGFLRDERHASSLSTRTDSISEAHFNEIVADVRRAIEAGIHPTMISQGSSGSYFVRDSAGRVVGVFKPKDEEPYAAGNPKWNKWIHRNLFPCFFGRACLIPNLSYVSEAAAYTLDCRLETNIVPYTGIVHLSSKSFHYDLWDRRNFYRRRKPFPMKVGSFQVFLKGYKDANLFLREHSWPDPNSATRAQSTWQGRGQAYSGLCRPTTPSSTRTDRSTGGSQSSEAPSEAGFEWDKTLKVSFREELEKLVILDYIMRNTDRGLDNWMIKVSTPCASHDTTEGTTRLRQDDEVIASETMPYCSHAPMQGDHDACADGPSISIGAIDNSLSWPWKHPDAWRSFPFGWLFLPVSLIGQPFSRKTRDHFITLLTSNQWWTETQSELRKIFAQDADFQEKMFARQIAVMKGQAWNVVETLKTPDHGPLELTRRTRVCVWDDIVEIPIALPLRPSTELAGHKRYEEQKGLDEMDIGISDHNVPNEEPSQMGTPGDIPKPYVFDRVDGSQHHNGHASGGSPSDGRFAPSTKQTLSFERQPKRPSSTHNSSHQDSHPGTSSSAIHREGYESRSSRTRSHGAHATDIDELEGDLGYNAAHGMEGRHRKVIIERLETVKSKQPFFACC